MEKCKARVISSFTPATTTRVNGKTVYLMEKATTARRSPFGLTTVTGPMESRMERVRKASTMVSFMRVSSKMEKDTGGANSKILMEGFIKANSRMGSLMDLVRPVMLFTSTKENGKMGNRMALAEANGTTRQNKRYSQFI